MDRIYKIFLYILLFSSLNSLTWQTQVVDAAGNVGKYTSIQIDNQNRYYISYYDSTNGDLKFAYYDGLIWKIETVDGLFSDVGKWTSISLDLNNRPHISYYDVSNGDLKYAYYNGLFWVIETVDNIGNVGQFTSIYVDQNGVPHISYFDNTNTALKYAYKPTSSWIIETVDNSANVGRYTSIIVDENGKVHISYNDQTNNALKYATGNYGNWQIQTIVNNQYGSFTSISLDNNHYPFISHRKYGGPGSEGLYLHFFNGNTWQSRGIDLPGGGSLNGRWTSIKYDKTSRNVWISYYNGDNGDLKVAYSSDYPNYNTFNVLTIDATGDLGISSSLALTTYGTPVISYYDATNQDLKIAELRDVDPPSAPLNLTANGDNPSPWNNTGIFELNWVNPQDESGIKRALYKLYLPPTSNFDTTGTLKSNSPDTVQINTEGIVPLYLWLQDNAGNLNYNNYSVVYLRYDISKPINAKTKISIKFSNTSTYTISWTKGSDLGNPPSGIMGYNVYYRDGNGPWILWLSNHPDTQEIFTGLDGHTYFFEVTSLDSAYNEEVSSFLPEDTLSFDLTPPSAPQNLYANGSSPSPWTNNPQFIITWVEPSDFSGIRKRLFKLGSPPNSSFDTTGTFHKSPDTVTISSEGIIDLYLWFEDSASNVNHNNSGNVKLRYDITRPLNSSVKIPEKSTNQINYIINWSRGSDNLSGIKFYELYYKVKGGTWNLYQSNIPDTFISFNFSITDTFYYFEVISVDSAGNKEILTGFAEDSIFVDFKAPSPPINLLANGSNPSPWTNINRFIITWTEPYDISGIRNRFYKLNSPPFNPYDTTGSFHRSPDTLSVDQEGIIPLYLWLSDSLGNISHNNSSSCNLRYDKTKPLNANCNIIESSTNQAIFPVKWTKGSDNLSGIMHYELYYRVKNSTWSLYADSIVDTFINFQASLYDTFYYFEVISVDSAGNKEILFGIAEDSIYVGNVVPLPPQNILANGSNPSPWTRDTVFVLTWQNPYDPTGIVKALYKLGSRPQSNYDTTGSLRGNPPDTVYTKVQGGVKLYMWLVNGLGNLDYHNSDSVLLRYDPIPPQGATASTPLYSINDTLTVTWTSGEDFGGSGIKGYDVYYKDGEGQWNLLIGDINSLSYIFIGQHGHKYFFEVVSKDSAGNVEVQTSIPEDSVIFDLVAPTITSIIPSHGSFNVPYNTNIKLSFSEKLNRRTVTDSNFEIRGKISGFHTFNLTYDSINFVITLDPHTGFSSQETVFVSVSQNITDVAGNRLTGQRNFFFITELRPDTEGPVSIASINPLSPEPFNYLDINVIVSDTGRGNSIITYAEFFIDSIGQSGSGIPLEPSDGNYDENFEEVYKKIDLVPLNFKAGETHYIFVHAKDINNNFGKYDTIKFVISPDDDTLPPSFIGFTQGYINPNTNFYIKGIIQDPSGVYDDNTGSLGQGVYLLWDSDGEINNTFNELQLDRISGDTFKTLIQIPGQDSGEIVYKVYAHDNDFDTGHAADRKKGESPLFRVIFYVPMVANLSHSPDIVYIGDSLKVEVSANISFGESPVCSLITSRGSLKMEFPLFEISNNLYRGKIITEGADIGIARIVAHYKDYGTLKKIEDTVLIQAKGEFLPENMVYVWPNPVNSEGNFHFYINQNARVQVEIFDIRGKKIMESSGIFKGGVKPHTINSNAIKLNLRNLAPGVYIFRLKADAIDTKESKTVLKKFAIVR
ncbi:MAG: Ig-like domain-containing protein [candidate division WOR-3 bacterium]